MGITYQDIEYDTYITETHYEYYALLESVAKAHSLKELSDSLENVSEYVAEHEILRNGDNDEMTIKDAVTAHAYSNIKELVAKFIATSAVSFFIGALLTLLSRSINVPI